MEAHAPSAAIDGIAPGPARVSVRSQIAVRVSPEAVTQLQFGPGSSIKSAEVSDIESGSLALDLATSLQSEVIQRVMLGIPLHGDAPPSKLYLGAFDSPEGTSELRGVSLSSRAGGEGPLECDASAPRGLTLAPAPRKASVNAAASCRTPEDALQCGTSVRRVYIPGVSTDRHKTTERLVTQAQKGDHAALEALFTRYLPRVRWIVARRPLARRARAQCNT